ASGDLPPVNRASHYLQVVARLKHDVPLDRARADLDRIAAVLATQYPDNDADLSVLARPLSEQRVAGIRTALLVLLGAVGFVVLSLAPALQAAQADGGEALKGGGRTGAAGEPRQRLRSILVVAEVALSVVLLVGAALALRSFVKLTQVNPGFEADDQLTFTVVLAKAEHPDAPRMIAFTRAIDGQLSATPGVLFAGATTHLPFSGQNLENGFNVDGYEVAPGGQPP